MGEPTAVQRRQQVGLDQMRAAPTLTRRAPAGRPRHQPRVENAARRRGQRQQADQDVAPGEEGRQPSAPAKHAQPASSRARSGSSRVR